MFPKPSPESPPMFDSPFVDRFSRTHWSVVPLLYGPAAALWLWIGTSYGGVGPTKTLGLFASGLLVWTLTEYWLHRVLFHWIPQARWGERFHFLLHGVHHKWPRDRYRLVMPPAVSVTLFWVFFGLFFVAMGRYSWSFHAGFTIGYMLYDLIHYYVHHNRPQMRMMKHVRAHHLTHHAPYAKHGGKFGVSTTLWDHVFRTY
ncbi:MAG: sterol desaturase family protein [Polyangiales bacterium]